MAILKKYYLVNALSEKTDLTKKAAKECVDVLFESIQEALKENNTVDIYQFGKFYITENAGRKGINPLTKEEIEIKPSKSIRFKASKSLKDSVK